MREIRILLGIVRYHARPKNVERIQRIAFRFCNVVILLRDFPGDRVRKSILAVARDDRLHKRLERESLWAWLVPDE